MKRILVEFEDPSFLTIYQNCFSGYFKINNKEQRQSIRYTAENMTKYEEFYIKIKTVL
jgi:hypothetical protein